MLSGETGQLRVNHPLPLPPVCAVQLDTGTLLVLMVLQTVSTKPGPVPDAALQTCTPVVLSTSMLHVRLTQLLPAAAVCGVQVSTTTLVVVTVLQVRWVKLLPESGD